jgi:hypothetical protein
MMPTIELHNLGSLGVIKDLPAHTIPPEAWSDANNVRFQEGHVQKYKGHTQIFGTPTVTPGWGINVPAATQNYWIYTSKTKAYVFEGGIHTNITRQTAGVDVDYTASEFRQWNGGVLGGVPILNNGNDVPQYWPALVVSTKLANLVNWPSTLRAKVVRPFGPFLVALNITDGVSVFPHMYWWSHPADPGSVPVSWDYTDATKDAGRRELTDVDGGNILDALMLRNLLIVYKETSTHYVRFIGGNQKMGSDLLFSNSGILAPRCVTTADRGKKHFVVTQDDVIQHNGQEAVSLLDRRMRKFLFTDIDTTNYVNAFCLHNPAQREAWFCYPPVGETFPKKVLVWNYDNNTLQFRDFAGTYGTPGTAQVGTGTAWDSLLNTWDEALTPWSLEGRRQLVLFDPNTTKIFKADDGETFAGTTFTAFVERLGLAVVGRDRTGQPKVNFTNRKLLKRIWPKITGNAKVNVRCGAQESLGGVVNWQPVQEFDPATQRYLDFTANGLLLCIRFESTSGLTWQLEGYDLEIEVLGRL